MKTVQRYSNKEVSFRYKGKSLYFFLSQALFSSFEIDRGSRMLLKTLVNPLIPFSPGDSVLDIGCGTGVLGISLKAAYPDIQVTMQDRDALAVHFASVNSRRNGVDAEVTAGLAFQNLETGEYDLIVSNIPAKAGAPVIADFIANSLSALSEKGYCAVVIVSTLTHFLEKTILDLGGRIILKEETRDYSVFHFTETEYSNSKDKKRFSLDPYIRDRHSFKAGTISYRLETVYNLPGFDTVPYDALIVHHASISVKRPVDIFMWNPGQGHIPLILLSGLSRNPDKLILASRDILELEISYKNCKNRFPELDTETRPAPDFLSSLDGIIHSMYVINICKSGERKILPEVMESVLPLTAPRGKVVITGKSSALSEISKGHRGWKQIGSKKYRSFRILIFQKHE